MRELELGFLSAASRMNHFGMDYMVRRSTLSDANARRCPAFFEAVYNALLQHFSPVLADSRPVKGLKGHLFIMDSTTISLFSQIFKGTGRDAINGQKKGGVKAHTVIKADEDVPFFVNITFITNDFDSSASMICETYRRHWQVETLYKRLKQNFTLKYFLGDNRNAIQIQTWGSLIAWLLMQIVQKRATRRKWSLSNLMTAIHILLNSYINLYDFLNRPEGQWLNVIKNRNLQEDFSPQLELFPQDRGANYENYKTSAYLQAISQ